MNRADSAVVESAPKVAPGRRARGRRRLAIALAVGAVLATAVAVPFAMVELGSRRAIACFAVYEAPREPARPVCGGLIRWFIGPTRLPFVPTARYRAEELGARVAVAEYRDAAVGRPEREAMALAAEGMLAGERLLAKGSQRPVLWDLGPAIGAPDLGRDAAELGDHRTLASRGEAWLAWPVRLAALHAALDEGDVARAIALAKRYAEWDPRDEEVRAAVGALLCLGDEPSHGMRMLETLQDDRAKRKYASMSRDFGDVRAMVVACAARAKVPPPPRPADGDAGHGDLLEARTVLRLRLTADGGEAVGSASEALDAATELLETAPRSTRARVMLLAGAVELAASAKRELPPTKLARLATAHVDAGESALVGSPIVTALDLLDDAPGIAPTLPAPRLADAADRLETASKQDGLDDASRTKLLTAAGAVWLEAARSFAQAGDATHAARTIERAGALVLPTDAARKLALASALHATGELRRARDELLRERVAAEAERVEDPASRAIQAATCLELAEVYASLGNRADAATQAAAAVENATKASDLMLLARARWTALALGGVRGHFAGNTSTGRNAWPWVGFADHASGWMRPEPARLATLDAALAAWQRALEAPAPDRLALRYEAMRHRGDAPRWLVPHLALGAALLAGAPGEVEVWLDAFAAVDSRRFTHRTYAWARADAARWRGDAPSAETWTNRLRVLRTLAADPSRAEIARFLGI